MRRLLILALLVCLGLGTPALAQRYNQFQIQFVDEFGDPVNMGTSVSLYIYQAGTTTELTCYKDRGGTQAVTQPVTDDSTNTPLDYTNGLMTFWAASADYKIYCTDGTYNRTVDNLTSSKRRFAWPSYLTALSSYSLGASDDLDFSFAGVIIDGDTAGRLDIIPDADASIVAFGDTSNQLDVYFYGGASDYMWWDEGNQTLKLVSAELDIDDNGSIFLGTGDDIEIRFDGTDMDILSDDDLINFGADGEGPDIYWYSETAGDYVFFDEDNLKVLFTDIDLQLDDDAVLYLGSTAGDITLQFNGTDFLIDASTADEGLKFGDTTTGFDMTIYYETAGTITTDYDGDLMQFSDAIDLVFGTDGDFIIESDTAKTLEILPGAATDDYAVNLGVDQSGVDIKAFGATTGEYFSWDASADSILVNAGNSLFTQTDAEANQFKVDATGTVAGFAVVVETTDGGVQINADGASNGDITIDAQDDITITADGIITTDGAFYPTSRESQTHVANDTLDNAADVGRLHLVGTDAVVLTLPAVATGLKYKIMNIGADGTVEIHVDTNAADKILGGCGFTALDDGDKITNTKATADIGDYVVIEYGTADGWYITEMVGTWADGG